MEMASRGNPTARPGAMLDPNPNPNPNPSPNPNPNPNSNPNPNPNQDIPEGVRNTYARALPNLLREGAGGGIFPDSGGIFP